MKKMRKSLSIMTAVLLLMALIPMGAYAGNDVPYVDAAGVAQTPIDTIDITTASTTLSAGWYSVPADTSITGRLEVSGAVNLILIDGITLTVSDGIHVTGSNSLTIWGGQNGTGTLNATSTVNINAGIGGNGSEDCGTVTINGGTIVASGFNGAGIGSGGMGITSGIININGGNVTASTAGDGAAIGGGMGSNGGTINISGGNINATGGTSGAGIGGGNHEGGGTINISGGNINATGGSSNNGGGAGIGGGSMGGGGGTIIISGSAKVMATGGAGTQNGTSGGAGIGGGGGAGIGGGDGSTTTIYTTGVVEATGGLGLGSSASYNGANIGNGGGMSSDGASAGSLVTATAGPNGSISRVGSKLYPTASLPANEEFIMIANTGFEIDAITVGSSPVVPAVTPYTLDIVAGSDYEVEVTLKTTTSVLTLAGVPATGTMYVGDQIVITPTLSPAGSTDSNMGSTGWTWNTAVHSATFSSPATFTAISAGMSIITYITSGGITASTTITVLPRPGSGTTPGGGTTASGAGANPKTADEAPLGLLISLIAIAGAALIIRRRFVKN